jgi:endonuclease/exonuclease/phosphatase (EEP) superfamily protein YafD
MLNRLLGVFILGGLLPLGATLWWPFELVSHFRLQYVAAATVFLALALITRKRLLAPGLAAVIALNAWPVLPYLPREPAPAAGEALTILNLNANARNPEHDRVLAAIRTSGADVVSLIELSTALAARLGELTDIYPYRVTAPANSNFGIGVLSRRPLAMDEVFELGPTMAISVRVMLPAASLRLIAVHLRPPVRRQMAAARNRQLDTLAMRAQTGTDPLVVCGDFNLSPYSPYFRRFESAAAVRDTRRGRGIGISWPTALPLLGIPIDHCFVRGPLAAERVERMDQTGSDHYPVRIQLRGLEPE